MHKVSDTTNVLLFSLFFQSSLMVVNYTSINT